MKENSGLIHFANTDGEQGQNLREDIPVITTDWWNVLQLNNTDNAFSKIPNFM